MLLECDQKVSHRTVRNPEFKYRLALVDETPSKVGTDFHPVGFGKTAVVLTIIGRVLI